ncbi:unnamed protein product [Paramecium sonneborni]|uniref:Uncharacterized protein n=1 Tax=Paramecium sonneborni TaxID=65129 RepID=A0A8S1KE57_9CILI|nr:unnamed protein product [Paramecium sonneborni]
MFKRSYTQFLYFLLFQKNFLFLEIKHSALLIFIRFLRGFLLFALKMCQEKFQKFYNSWNIQFMQILDSELWCHKSIFDISAIISFHNKNRYNKGLMSFEGIFFSLLDF